MKLNESTLRKLIRESIVRTVLKEMKDDDLDFLDHEDDEFDVDFTETPKETPKVDKGLDDEFKKVSKKKGKLTRKDYGIKDDFDDDLDDRDFDFIPDMSDAW